MSRFGLAIACTRNWFSLICLTLSCPRKGTGVDRDPRRWRKKETIPTVPCHHQNGFALRWAVAKPVLEGKGEPRRNRTEVLLLSLHLTARTNGLTLYPEWDIVSDIVSDYLSYFNS